MKQYSVTSVDTGQTRVLSASEAHKLWGNVGFREILKGCFPNIVAVEVRGVAATEEKRTEPKED